MNVGRCGLGPLGLVRVALSFLELFLDQLLDRHRITFHALSADEADALLGQEGMLTKGLAGVDVGDVDLEDRCCDGGDTIANGDRCMGISARIDDDAPIPKSDVLQMVDDASLVVGLIVVELDCWKSSLQGLKEVLKGLRAIDLRLTSPQQIEVGAIDDVNLLHGSIRHFREELQSDQLDLFHGVVVLFEFIEGRLRISGLSLHEVVIDVLLRIFIHDLFEVVVDIQLGT